MPSEGRNVGGGLVVRGVLAREQWRRRGFQRRYFALRRQVVVDAEDRGEPVVGDDLPVGFLARAFGSATAGLTRSACTLDSC